MATNSSVEERKKRTLDALEKRFAQEKAEHLLQQEKSKKRLHGEQVKTTQHIKHSPAKESTAAPSTNSSYKKGNITFSGYRNKEESSEPAYFELTHDAHKNLLRDGAGASEILSVDHILHDLFQHGNSAEKYMQGSRSMKIDNWILLDNVVPSNSMSSSAQSRSLKTNSRRSKSHKSLKQHKKSGSFNLHKEFQNFELFKPMHEMWKSYITQLMKHVGKNQLAQCLLNADLHGSLILVVQCKVSTFCGVRGIMVRETAETFGIVTEDNKFRVVPKKLSVFVLQVDCWKITLLGDKLTSRSQVLSACSI